jgi:hypothetical protein
MPGSRSADDAVMRLKPISLEELDEQAELLHRLDTKYLPVEEEFARLIEALGPDLEVLEIDGRRAFSYRSTYFDTPDLRCFHDHEQDRLPRFKARVRRYLETERCVFEVKLKLAENETDKRQSEHSGDGESELDEAEREFLSEVLRSAAIEPPREPLRPVLTTSFRRRTILVGDGERLTCDTDVRARKGEATTGLERGRVLVEVKSEDGEGPAVDALEELGVAPVSLSKYRVGMGVLLGENDPPDAALLFHMLA